MSRAPDSGAGNEASAPGHPAPTASGPSPWPAAAAVAAAVFVLGLLLRGTALPGVFYDDGIYLLIAKSLAGGHGLHYAGVPGAPPAGKYPPLFPLLLAGAWRLAPELPRALALFRLLQVLFAALGAGAFALYLERGLRLPRWLAVVLALACWATVDTWRYAAVPLSEPLFTLTLALGLLTATALERAPGRARGVALLAGAFALAYYTRTIGFVLALGACGALLLQRRARPALALAAACAALALPWVLWERHAAAALPASLADLLGPYSDWLSSQISASPGTLARFVLSATPQLGQRVLATALPGVPLPLLWYLAPLLVLAGGLGVRELWRRSPASVLTLAAYLGVLWLWPFVARRLLAPVAPWLVLLPALGFYAGARLHWRPAARRAAGALGVLWGAWFLGASALSLARHRHDQPLLARSRGLELAAAAVRAHTPPDAVIGSAELWAGIHLLTGRPAAPSIRFRPAAADQPLWGTPAEQYRLWREAGIGYLWVTPGAPIEGEALQRLDAACGPGSLAVIARTLPGTLVRLQWSPECRQRLAPSS